MLLYIILVVLFVVQAFSAWAFDLFICTIFAPDMIHELVHTGQKGWRKKLTVVNPTSVHVALITLDAKQANTNPF
jgi:hypothetical protein